MNPAVYLLLLITVVVAVAVWLDRRWSKYIAGANTAAETPTRVLRSPVVVHPQEADSLDTLLLELLMTPTSGPVPSPRRPGAGS